MTFAEKFLENNFNTFQSFKSGQRPNAPTNTSESAVHKNIRSNTTVFAIKYTGGAIIAADRRMTAGLDLVSDKTEKVKQISKYGAIACAGSCNVITYLEDNLSAMCNSFEARYHQELSPDGISNYLKHLVETCWYEALFYYHWSLGYPILATFDLSLNEPRIFSYDENGFNYESEIIAGTGCGYDAVKNIVIDRWKKDCDEDFAIELAVRAMIHSGNSSIGVSDARNVLPILGLVNAGGFKWIDKKLANRKKRLILKGLEALNVS